MTVLVVLLGLVGLVLASCAAGPLPEHATESPQEQDVAPRLIGGSDTAITEHPWQVYLLNGRSTCGGSILNERWILTAGHCIEGDAKITVRAGSTNKYEGGRVHDSDFRVAHPKYSLVYHQPGNRQTSSARYDLGLVHLSSPLQFGRSVRPVTLVPVGQELAPGRSLTLAGWGTLIPNVPFYPEMLQSTRLDSVSRSDCETEARRVGKAIDDTMVCAGTTGRAASYGDSGGPLVTPEGVQVGITSWVTSEGIENPKDDITVFTNLANAEIRNWMKEQMDDPKWSQEKSTAAENQPKGTNL